MSVHLFTPHIPTLCVLHLRVCVCVTPMFSIPPPLVPLWMCFQNHEQLRDHDSDLLRNDGDLTFTFGDTAITANGASGGGGGADAGSGWSANGKRSGSTSEEALERELDSREQELLSRGTRLVFPIEDHAWPLPSFACLCPTSLTWPFPDRLTLKLSLHPGSRAFSLSEITQRGRQEGRVQSDSEVSPRPGAELKDHFILFTELEYILQETCVL